MPRGGTGRRRFRACYRRCRIVEFDALEPSVMTVQGPRCVTSELSQEALGVTVTGSSAAETDAKRYSAPDSVRVLE